MEKRYWSIKALAIAFGIFWGGYLFLVALFEMLGISFWWFQPTYVELFKSAYPGFAATWFGAFAGLVGGFICGAICGVILGWLYNTTVKIWG